MSAEKKKHVQHTFISLGDEFLIQYFITAHTRFRETFILSRLFSMGHSLELYLKAALVNEKGIPPRGHDVQKLLRTFDQNLCLTTEEIEAGNNLFSPNVTNFDLGLHERHRAALELYQAKYFLKDLKYYLTAKDQKVIFPIRHSLIPINNRYLNLIYKIRSSVQSRSAQQDHALLESASLLNFEYNPANIVVTGKIS